MEKKINILFLYSSKGFGGMVQNISLVAKGLDKDIFNVFVAALTNKEDPDAEARLEGRGGSFIRIDETKRVDLAAIRRLASFIDESRIDILSCHGYKANIYGVVLRRFFGIKPKIVTMAHGWVTPGFKLNLYYILDKIATRWFDRIILVASGLRRELAGFMIPRNKIVVVNNAIDPITVSCAEDRDSIRNGFGLTPNDIVAGYIGRLSAEKDIANTIRAVKAVSSEIGQVKFLLAGDGRERGALEKLSEDLGIRDKVIFAGYRKDAARVYRAIDLYVSSARKEGLPNSLLEAQAAGLPCVVTDIGGNDDIVKDGVNGYMFKPGDYKALARKMAVLFKDKALAQAMSARARQVIADSFSLEYRIRRLEEIYLNL